MSYFFPYISRTMSLYIEYKILYTFGSYSYIKSTLMSLYFNIYFSVRIYLSITLN